MAKWTASEIEQMIARMRAKPDGFRVGPQTVPLIIAALETYLAVLDRAGAVARPVAELIVATVDRHLAARRAAGEVGPFHIDEVDESDRTAECLAICRNVSVAHKIFLAAVESRPGRLVILRDRARVIRRCSDEGTIQA